jgi:hypothetical protein
VAFSIPADNPGPDQHSSLDRPTPPKEKREREKKSLNKQQQQKRHVAKRVGALSAGVWGREIPHGTVNKPAGEGRSGSTPPATRSRKACKSGGGRKTPQERREGPLLT